MVDQAIFALMDIFFGIMADRVGRAWQRLVRVMLWLTTVSAIAFVALPLAGASPGLLLAVTLVWVASASIVRAPTMVLLAKAARSEQQASLVVWYSGGMALAMALSPFVGLWLKGADPLLPFVVSAALLWVAVFALLRWRSASPAVAEDAPLPLPFAHYLPLLAGLALAAFGLQWHAFVNSAALYGKLTEAARVPWLMPWLWVGFAAAMPVAGGLGKRFGVLHMAGTGLLLSAAAVWAASAVNAENSLILLQLLAGFGWGLAFASLMSYASSAGTRGAEGVFMGSFFAVTALAAFARIMLASQWLPALAEGRYWLPVLTLCLAGAMAFWLARRLPGRT
jgi:MFS family permease